MQTALSESMLLHVTLTPGLAHVSNSNLLLRVLSCTSSSTPIQVLVVSACQQSCYALYASHTACARLVLRYRYRNSELMGGETCCHLLVLQISADLGRRPVISAEGNLCPLGVTTPGPPPSLMLGVQGQEGRII